ncbi:nucleotidyltransferase family protein [Skermania sp. ID1734]|uniref:BON domain-containing protein n=1 Tax=Skermania sp. ID1734 TaxID=2597516 RepID=UPI00118158E5|nr:BON domain-containing protein [Skermania sp. ID1734]TSD99507.1 nucleotidyltransferase family protein [Skermania sp. ID1734]
MSTIDRLLHTLTKVCNVLATTDIRFAVAGGCAAYARGGPPTDHDVDIFIKPSDVATAASALVAAGLRAAQPPENWLRKVYDGDTLVDLIFRPNDRPITDELLDRCDEMRVGTTTALVITGTDLMVDKLLVLDNHRLDFTALLQIARALREQVDWAKVREATAESPYARAFLGLVTDLGIAVPNSEVAAASGTRPQYVAAHLHRAIAEDPRTAEPAVQVTVRDGVLHVTGEVSNAQRRKDIQAIIREHAGTLPVHEDLHVLDCTHPGRPEEVR